MLLGKNISFKATTNINHKLSIDNYWNFEKFAGNWKWTYSGKAMFSSAF